MCALQLSTRARNVSKHMLIGIIERVNICIVNNDFQQSINMTIKETKLQSKQKRE